VIKIDHNKIKLAKGAKLQFNKGQDFAAGNEDLLADHTAPAST